MTALDYEATAPKRNKKKKRHTHFWRACRYLAPYRGIVTVSVVCALLVGVISTGGLGAMLPIFKVLLEDQTVTQWADRQIAEQRLDVSFTDDPAVLRLDRVGDDGPAQRAGLVAGDEFESVSAGGPGIPLRPISFLATTEAETVRIQTAGGKTVTVTPRPQTWYFRLGHSVAARFPTHPVAAIAAVAGIIFILAVLGSTVRFFQEHLSDVAAIHAVNDIRRRLYDHVLHTPLAFFARSGSSDVTSRLVQDTQGLQDGFKTVLGATIQEPIKAAMAFGLSLYVSPWLTLFIVLFAPMMALLIKKFGKKMRRASRKALQESSSMLGQIEATLQGIRVVKSANAERFERRRYGGIMKELVHQQVKMSRIDSASAPTLETLSLLAVGAVVIFAAYLVKVSGSLEKASFFLVMACLMAMAESLRKLSKVNNHLQRANAAAARVFEMLDVPVERPRGLEQPRPLKKLPPVRQAVRFENVTFTYPTGTTPAVQDVSLTVPRGQSVAVVGRNGSGKTTLLALLPRFYDPESGRITIDGVDVRDVTLNSLRRQIGIVTQDAVIFPGTIADNIAYGLPRTSRDAIVDAAKRAFAHEFILQKPDGYDTVLGEMGGSLSGGQKQRLNIARAILRQSPILILDEATSQVDAESEHLIQQAIQELMKDRTTFVIAHRFSTITSADTIVVMDRGRIVGQGKHDELLRTCDTYQQLYERQLFVPPTTEKAEKLEEVETT